MYIQHGCAEPARTRLLSRSVIYPECLTSGADETEALAEAADALDVAIAGRIVYPPANGDPIPVPSARRTDEHDVAVPADTAAKAALMLRVARKRALTQRIRAPPRR